MKKLSVIIITFILLVSVVSALDIDESTLKKASIQDHEEIIDSMSIPTLISYYLQTLDFGSLTVVDVGGKQYECSAFADVNGFKQPTNNEICHTNSVGSPSKIMQVYLMREDMNGVQNFLGEKQVDFGEKKCFTGLDNSRTYFVELYFCNNQVSVDDPCFDSDGIDFFKSGYVTQGGDRSDDTCVNNNEVLEYMCAGDDKISEVHDCGSGFMCNVGKCVRVDDSGGNGGTTNPPSLFAVSESIQANKEDKTITVQAKIRNNGGNMDDSWVLEMQPRPKGFNPLAFVSSQTTCNANNPENVHKQFKLGAGEETTITLQANTPDFQEYDVYLVSVDRCWTTQGGNTKVAPYGAGRLVGTVDFGGEGEDPKIDEPIAGFNVGTIMLILFILLIALLVWKRLRKK